MSTKESVSSWDRCPVCAYHCANHCLACERVDNAPICDCDCHKTNPENDRETNPVS